MKKRLIFGICILLVILALACFFLFRTTPLLAAGTDYEVYIVTAWTWDENNHFQTESIDLSDSQKAALLDCLSQAGKQRTTEMLFHKKNTSVPVPEWIQWEMIVGSGTQIFSVLVGEDQVQQRDTGYGPPVYQITNEGTLRQVLAELSR